MLEYESVQVGIDIGASKTVVVVAQKDFISSELLILGVGESPNLSGIKFGKIVDLNNTIISIQNACESAKLMSGVDFNSANINIPGEVDSINSHGLVTIARKDREVRMKDVERVVGQAQTINMKGDRSILHLFPQYFQLDEQNYIKDPIGMTGLRLQGNVHIVVVPMSHVVNTVKCFDKAEIKPLEGIFAGYASSQAVLTSEDKEAGVLLLDIGAGSVDLVGYKNGSPFISGVIMIGGDSITRDLSIGLKIPETIAESLKKERGVAYSEFVDPLEEIEIGGFKGKELKRVSAQKITNIIEPRVQEIFLLIQKFLESKNIMINDFSSIVLTGGCANLQGIVEVAENIFKVVTRIGNYHHLGGLVEKVNFPEYATVIGLCIGDSQDLQLNLKNYSLGKEKNKKNLLGKVKGFFKDMLG